MYSNIYNINTPFGYLITNEWNHELVEVDSEFWVGTFLNLENDAEILTYNDDKIMVEDSEIFTEYNPSNGFSIADIDKDGLHEIIFINTSGQIIAYNGNGTLVDGFPMGNNYHGVVLIVSEKDTDDIVMISRNLSHINLVWLNGDLISIPSINEQSDLMILSNYLTDGSRYYDLDSDESFFKIGEDQYWTQRYNSHSHYPLAKEPYQFVFYPQTQNIVDNFYNYPNPIKDGKTKFRFFINEPTDDIKINIFNIAGNLVDSFSKDNLVIYEYNEIEWNTDNFFPGLYYAEILSSNVQQDIIKVVIGH